MSASLDIVSRRELSRTQWNDFVDASDEAWLWHRAEVQDALLTWPGRSDEGFAVVEGGTKILAVVPLQRVEQPIGGILPATRLESLGGVARANGLAAKRRAAIAGLISVELANRASIRRTHEVLLSLSPLAPAYRGDQCPRVNPLVRDFGCVNVLSQTWVLDLAPGPDRLWANLEGRARTAVRKADREGVTIRAARADEDDLGAYYDLHLKTCRRTGIEPHTREYFAAIWRELLPLGIAEALVAEQNCAVIAAANFGIYKNAAWYWTGASSDDGLRVEANSLLQWSAIRSLSQRGFAWFESGEAFPSATGKQKGLSDFKRSFGGELHPLYRGQIVGQSRAARVGRAVRALRGDG